MGALPPGLQAAAGSAVADAIGCDHVLRPVDGLVALGARLGRVFGKIRVLCDGGCAQVARRIGLGLPVAAL